MVSLVSIIRPNQALQPKAQFSVLEELTSQRDPPANTMSNPDLNPERAAELSVLVNPERIRSSIKRLFHNRIDEVLGELFQNSQRAILRN